MPKQKSMNTRMARAFFRHYEHKHQFMKQYLANPPSPAQGGRLSLASIGGLVASWDASDDTTRTPTDSDTIVALDARAGSAGSLTASADGGGTVAVVRGERDYINTTGGNGMRRLEAADGVTDNLFAGGGMVALVLRDAGAMSGVLAGKWNGQGWLLFGQNGSLALEVYDANGSQVDYYVNLTLSAWNLVEIEWDCSVPGNFPVIRVNGAYAPVSATGGLGASFDDSPATLCIGNRNWGGKNTPWAGDIGEILMFSAIPTVAQKNAVRADLAAHWGITLTPSVPTTYYVSPSGSNTAAGTSAQPWQTIGHAVSRSFVPGDQIVVRPGTYTEVVTINQGGQPEGNLTIKSETPHQAKIVAPAGQYSALMVRADYVTVDGFDVQGGGGHAIDVEASVHVRVLNNLTHDSGGSGISFNRCEFITIEGNIAHDNASTNEFHCSGISIYQSRNLTGDTSTPGFRAVVRNNISYDNITGPSVVADHTDGNGIIIDDFQSTQTNGFPNYTYPTLVENNLCYGNGSKGIQVTWSDNVTVRNNTVWHNNVDNLNSGTWRGELNQQQSSGCLWVNNIAVANPATNANNSAIGSFSYNDYVNVGSSWRNNLTFNGAPGQASIATEGGDAAPTVSTGNILGADPLFVSAGTDFRLQSNSPAINAGTSAYGVHTVDLDGRPRVAGAIDIGAYER